MNEGKRREGLKSMGTKRRLGEGRKGRVMEGEECVPPTCQCDLECLFQSHSRSFKVKTGKQCLTRSV